MVKIAWRKYRNFCVVILLLGIALLLAACDALTEQPEKATLEPTSPSPTKAGGRGAGDTLRILLWDAPSTLNPHLSSARKDDQVGRIVYEPLASFDKEGELIPFLAAVIPSLAKDGKSVTWKLKQGVRWSDGEPFTADDVRFTYEFVTNPGVGSPSAVVYDTVKSVLVIDDYTVKINFKEVNPAWWIPFVGARGVILPEHKFEAFNGPNVTQAPANKVPVGTGPYQVVPPGIEAQESVFLGSRLIQTIKIVFAPNPFFREAHKPYFSRIELRGGSEPGEAARLVLQTDQVDYAWNLVVSPAELSGLSAQAEGQIITYFGTTVEQIEFNWTDPYKETEAGERSSLQFPHPIFTDTVRQALAHAIDRKTILALYGATGQATSHILVSPPQYQSDKSFYEFDLQKAAALLDEAGWKDSDRDGIRDKHGVKLSLLYQAYTHEIVQQTQKIIQKDFESIGVDVELKSSDASVFYGGNIAENPDHNGRFLADMQEADWSSTGPDPGLYLQYWTCEQIPQMSNNWNGLNFRRWCNLEYDALYEQSRAELDPEKRRRIFIEMNDMLTEQVVTIPLVHRAQVSGTSRDLDGFDPTPWDAETWNIKDWRRVSP